MITELTSGCPVKEFVVQDSLFAGHECSGLCWFHGSLSPEEIQLRLAVVEPTNGAFLIIKGPTTLYQISIWIEGKFDNNDLLFTPGHNLTRPCCVSVWQQRGHLSHPPQILASLATAGGFCSDSDDDGRGKITRKLAFKARRRGNVDDLVDL
eukprot:sb/3473419/